MAMTVHSDKLRASWGWMALFAVISLIGGVLALTVDQLMRLVP